MKPTLTIILAIAISMSNGYSQRLLKTEKTSSIGLIMFPQELSIGAQVNQKLFKFNLQASIQSNFNNFSRMSYDFGFYPENYYSINAGIGFTQIGKKKRVTPEMGIHILLNKTFTFTISTDLQLGYTAFSLGLRF